MRPALHILLLLLFPLAAQAQVAITVNGGDSASFSPSGCGNQFTVNWNLGGTVAPCSPFTGWVTSGTCGDAPGTGDHQFLSVDQGALLTQRSGNATFTAADLPGFSGGDSGISCGDVTTRTWRICTYVETPGFTGFGTTCGTNNQKLRSTSSTVSYDGQPPASPKLESVVSQDEGLRATVTNVPGDAVEVRVGTRVAGTGAAFTLSDRVATAGDTVSVSVTGLQNEVQYEVVAYAVDAADNTSAASDALIGTPRKTEGFFGQYRSLGGEERGGCTSVPVSSLLPLAGLLLALARRRRG
ncbi:MAG: hypothetical protein RL653_1416 [Pseudomonadota bacterium]|jgi:uncharacterized protein (TIGR03382 family)